MRMSKENKAALAAKQKRLKKREQQRQEEERALQSIQNTPTKKKQVPLMEIEYEKGVTP